MQQHLLITKELKATMPNTIKILFTTYINMVVTNSELEFNGSVEGENAIVEGSREDIISWLTPFDYIWVGNGSPQTEEFEIMHIAN